MNHGGLLERRILLTVCAMLTSALSLMGCVFHEPYPSSWSAPKEGCTDISGVYADAGERRGDGLPFPFHDTVTASRSLSGLLLGAIERGKPFKVELTQRDPRLDLRVRVDEGVGARYSIPYRCTPEGVEVTLPARWVTQGLGVVRAWGVLRLTRETDGNLIGSLAYQAYGLILVVPVVSRGNLWYRFPPADAPAQR